MPKKAVKAKKPAKKAVAKKAVAKKAVKKPAKKVAKKKVVKVAPKKAITTAIKTRYSKTQTVAHVATETGLTKKQVSAVLDEMQVLIARHLKKGGAGEFALPGIAKLRAVRKPATKARKGVNPFTGETTTFKAKPARILVKIRALKKLKDHLD